MDIQEGANLHNHQNTFSFTQAIFLTELGNSKPILCYNVFGLVVQRGNTRKNRGNEENISLSFIPITSILFSHKLGLNVSEWKIINKFTPTPLNSLTNVSKQSECRQFLFPSPSLTSLLLSSIISTHSINVCVKFK